MSCGKPTPVTVVPVQVPFGQSPSLLHGTPFERAAGTGAHLLGEDGPPDLVGRTERSIDEARQLLPVMDAVDHLLQLDRVPGLGSKP